MSEPLSLSIFTIEADRKPVLAFAAKKYEDAGAQKLLNEWKPEGHGPLVQIGASPTPVVVTTSVDSNMTSVAGD